jgi:N-acetylglutamate synthase-like GNAT family acetyltransferase
MPEFKIVDNVMIIRRERDNERIRELLSHYAPDLQIRGRYYVAEKDGETVGIVGLLFRSWYMTEVRHLYVWRRKEGIGSSLVQEALKRVKTPLACATVQADNPGAIRLFTKLGFTCTRKFMNPKTGRLIYLFVRNVMI